MKQAGLFALISLALVPSFAVGLDTIFAKGGTCMYKISKQYQKCMEAQNARLTREKDTHAPIYTRAALTDSLNKISCCAYWDFVDCVLEAAEEHCPGERRDMEAYIRQLGSAVPVEDCFEQYPRGSPQCGNSFRPLLSTALALISVILAIVYLVGL